MKILFVCEGNINRSQMASTLFGALVPEAEVLSAGVYADHPGEFLSAVSEGSIAAMKELGFDMSSNIITQLTREMVEAADKVILVGSVPGGSIPEYLKNSVKLETWDVPDPGYGQISIEAARDMILKYVKQLAEKLK